MWCYGEQAHTIITGKKKKHRPETNLKIEDKCFTYLMNQTIGLTEKKNPRNIKLKS